MFVAGVGLVVVFWVGLAVMGFPFWGGWHYDANSASAQRARTIQREIHKGMNRSDVERIFQDDVDSFHEDGTERPGPNAYWGKGVKSWERETDLFVFEKRPHFWDTYDTQWTIRVRFDAKWNVIEYELRPGFCCGP